MLTGGTHAWCRLLDLVAMGGRIGDAALERILRLRRVDTGRRAGDRCRTREAAAPPAGEGLPG